MREFIAGLLIGIAPGLFFAIVPHPTGNAQEEVCHAAPATP